MDGTDGNLLQKAEKVINVTLNDEMKLNKRPD